MIYNWIPFRSSNIILPQNLLQDKQSIKWALQVGMDSNADFMLDALNGSGADTSFVRRIDSTTGSAMILLQPSG